MKIFLFLTTILFAGILQSCSSSEGKNNKAIVNADEIPVQVMKLKQSEFHSEIQASGQFTTDDETNLAFKTGGVIDKIFVKEGDAIRKGELLAKLNLTEIDAQVAQARLSYEKAVRDLERVSNLYKDSVATLEQFQNAKTGAEVATQQYEAAKFNRSYSEIRAVNDGYVLRKLASEGQVIQSGTSVFQTNGANKNKWLLKIGVSDREWSQIKIGDNASIVTDAEPGKFYNAVVTRKSEGTDAATGSFTIELSLTKAPTSVASGMFGKATISPTKSKTGWTIPYDALLDGDAKNAYVFITNDNKVSQKVKVSVSSIERDNVIISAGLENAEALIVSGSAYLRDNSPIRIIEK
jgi:RND family efflux transporter MFP subunit